MYRQEQQVIEIEDFAAGGTRRALHPDPELYGSGWGGPETIPHLRSVLDTLLTTLDAETRDSDGYVVEIGCGGGRWTRFIGRHRQQSGNRYKLAITDATEVAFELTGYQFAKLGLDPAEKELICLDGRFELDKPADVVFSFDVFVHFDDQLILSYLDSIAAALRTGGKLLCSFACEFEPDTPGWERSDEWFNYVMRDGQFIGAVKERIEREFTWGDVQQMPSGYGTAFVVLTRK